MFLSKPGLRPISIKGLASGVLAALLVASVVGLGGAQRASADDCAGQCRAQHNRCRLETKGSPSCDGALQACLQRCLTPKK